MTDSLFRVPLLRVRVVSCRFQRAIATLIQSAATREGGSAYFCNVHMIVEARSNRQLSMALSRATWVWPDGKPLSLAMRLLGRRTSDQIAGPHVTEHLLASAADHGLSVFLYGGTQEQLDLLQAQIKQRFPQCRVVGAISPPFRPLGQEDLNEEAAHCAIIEESGAQLCFVGLGCPKQELWIDRNRHKTSAVLLGVGAAFPMLAGTMPRAPKWMVACCAEWAFRLYQEPRRLWKRYATTNPRYINLFLRQLWSR